MLHRILVVPALVLLIVQCFGATPVATISSTQAIVVSGITVPTNRVISWPVAVNDEIVTQAAPAMLRFTDGTQVTLQRNSRMKLVPGATGVEVKMLSGSAIYDLKPHSNVSIGEVAARSSTPAAARSGSMPVAMPLPRQAPSANETIATALASGGAQSGVAMATSDMKAGTFTPAPKARTLPSQGTSTVTLANGTILEVHLVSGGGPFGGPSVLVIDKIEFAVPDPERPGSIIYLTAPKGFVSPLIGASLTLPVGITFGTVPLNLILLNGTPITAAQLALLLQDYAKAAFSDPANNFLPGQQPTPPSFPSPVTGGSYSGFTT